MYLLLFKVARWLCHGITLLTLVCAYLSETRCLMSFVRITSLRDFLQFSSQSLRSWTWSAKCISQSRILTFLRKWSLSTLISWSRDNLRGCNYTSTCNCLLLTSLPYLLRIIQALVLRIDCCCQRLSMDVSFFKIIPFLIFSLGDAIIWIDGLMIVYFDNVRLAIGMCKLSSFLGYCVPLVRRPSSLKCSTCWSPASGTRWRRVAGRCSNCFDETR